MMHKVYPLLITALTLCLIAFFFLSCVPKEIRTLEIVQVNGIRLRGVSNTTLDMEVSVEIRNPYPASAQFKHLFFHIGFSDDQFGTGFLSDSTAIPARSTSSLDVPLKVNCKRVSEKDFETLFQSEIPYRINGILTLEEPVQVDRMKIDAGGKLATRDRYEIELEDRTVRTLLALEDTSIGEFWSRARSGEISLEIHNPFDFPIDVHSMKYRAGLDRDTLAEGEVNIPFRITPGRNAITVPVKAHPTGAIQGLLRGILDQRVPRLYLTADIVLEDSSRQLMIRLAYLPLSS